MIDYDRFSADDQIGRAVLDLGELLRTGTGTEKVAFDRDLSLNGVQVHGLSKRSGIRGSVRVVATTSSMYQNHSRSSRSVATKGSDPARAEDGDLDASEKRDYFPWDIMSGNAA